MRKGAKPKFWGAWFLLAVVTLSLAKELPTDELQRSEDYHRLGTEVLSLRGRAVHRRFFFPIYRLSLYLAQPAPTAEDMVNSLQSKYVRLEFLRSVKSEAIQNSFRDSFRDNCCRQCEALSQQLQKFLSVIPDVDRESVIEFSFLTHETRVFMPHYGTVSFPGTEFGKILLRTWLGEHPPSQRFKREILNFGNDRASGF